MLFKTDLILVHETFKIVYLQEVVLLLIIVPEAPVSLQLNKTVEMLLVLWLDL